MRTVQITLIGVSLLVGARHTYARCIVCWNQGGATKCISMGYDCKTQKANSSPNLWAKVTCKDLLIKGTGPGDNPFRLTGVSEPHGVSLPSEARSKAAEALTKEGILFFVDGSGDPRRILILVDEASLTKAFQVLRRASITDVKVEGPIKPRGETPLTLTSPQAIANEL